MPQIKDSLYEQLNPLTTVAGQHLVEDFSGDTLDTFRWKDDAFTGGTISMSDSVNGGLKLVSLTSNNSRLAITFNDIYQFDQTGSSIIAVTSLDKNSTTGLLGQNVGFSGDTNASTSEADQAVLKNNTAEGSNMQFFTKNGSSGVTDTGVAVKDDNTFFTTKIDLETVASCSINGVLVAQRSTLPNKAVMPYFFHITYGGGVSTISHIRYMEAWNH